MKYLIAIAMIVACTFALAVPAVNGVVMEVMNVEGYTYLRLKTDSGETWAAVSTAPVKVNDKVSIENAMAMSNFESKSLKKTFPSILFGTLGGTGSLTGKPSAAHSSTGASMVISNFRVAKANGPNARTVAEIATKSAELSNKEVLVRGRVVKYNAGIMGKNWIHLQDGSGSEAKNSNDLLVITTGQSKVGDEITVKGKVSTNKDFGSGYSYKVIVEDATLEQQ